MAAAFDLVIRNGMVADGTGADPRPADVAIVADRIVAVGCVRGRGREEIDAQAALVTPGFVDVHTHYDGQATWASQLSPSSLHGVTTVVAGNCGVGFAPCRPHERELLIKVMEGVEDIPEPVLAQGVQWEWETFPEFLDALGRRRYDIDIGAQVPHGPVRVYAMGRRGAEREPATREDMAVMCAAVQDGLRAGALGFTTSRTMIHRLKDGQLAPTITAGEDELRAIALGMREVDLGVLQGVDDWNDNDAAFALWQRLATAAGRPFSFSLVQRMPLDDRWLAQLEKVEQAKAAGLEVRGQVICRPIGLLFGLDLSFHPFCMNPSWGAIDGLPLEEKVRALRDPALRARLIAETPDDRNPQLLWMIRNVEGMYPFGDPPDYEPPASAAVAAQARALGKDPLAHAYDLLLEQDGHAVLYFPVSNFNGNSFDAIYTMLRHPGTILGIGDGGAHCGMISDASTTTFMLTYWTRDRKGEKIPVGEAVRKLTRDTAEALGLRDRGVLAPGYKADLNVIDYDRLYLHAPYPVRDLPSGGRRLMQRADGYVATVKSGTVTYRDGEFTGALPGRLIRGAQSGPSTNSRGSSTNSG
jgi:N-acyl-D-amino-acid deacylase